MNYIQCMELTRTECINQIGHVAIRPFFDLTHGKRPKVELYDIQKDPCCLNNLAGKMNFETIEKEMKEELMKELRKSEDPRIVGPDTEVFDSYIRYSPMREFPKPE